MRRLIASLSLLLFGCEAPTTESPTPDPRPSFLIILVDDLRYLPITPDLAGDVFMPETHQLLVEQGVDFQRGYVTTSLCCPSRSSILTGQYARTHGVHKNLMQHIDPTTRTIPKILHDAGYYTGLVGKYLNSESCDPPGEYDRWVCFQCCKSPPDGDAGTTDVPEGDGQTSAPPSCFGYWGCGLNVDGSKVSTSGYLTYRLRDYALDFIDRAVVSGKPFLLFFQPFAPHAFAQPAQAHQTLYATLGPNTVESVNNVYPGQPNWVQDLQELSVETLASINKFRRQQLQTMRAVDEAIGALRDELVARGLLDNTMIVFLSDNGYLWGEHRLDEKWRPFEEAHHVPFLVRYPPLAPNAHADDEHVVANIDLAPTVCDLSGAECPNDVDGVSLRPVLDGTATSWREEVLIEGRPPGMPVYAGVHTNRYVYVRYPTAETELYDLDTDQYQTKNLNTAADYANVLTEMQTLLMQYEK